MKAQSKLLALVSVILSIILIIGAIVSFKEFITINQYVVLAFGCLGAVNVITAMVKLKENTIFKRKRIIVTSLLLILIGLLSIFFSLVEADLTLEFMVYLSIIIGSLFIPMVDWNAKRKLTAINH